MRSTLPFGVWALALVATAACGRAPAGSDPGAAGAASVESSSSSGRGPSGSTSGAGGASASSSSSGATSSSSSGEGGAAPNLPPTGALDAAVAARMSDAHVPGLATCVVKHGEVAWCKAYGLADVAAQRPVAKDTAFLLASISKTVTATTLLQLWEQHAFELDDDVAPRANFSVHHPTSSEPITFRRLLTHTASVLDDAATLQGFYTYGGGDPTIPLADCMRGYFDPSGAYYSASGNFSPDPPGTSFAYSNEGVALLGYLAQAMGGQDFAALAKARVLAPLGMTRSSFRLADLAGADLATPHHWSGSAFTPIERYTFADYPDGGLFATAPDLARFLAALSAGGAYHGARVLQASTIAEMTKEQAPAIAPGQGLVLYHVTIGQDDWVGHSGGENGVATDMFFRASDGLGFVTLMNGDWPSDPSPVYALEDAIVAYGESIP